MNRERPTTSAKECKCNTPNGECVCAVLFPPPELTEEEELELQLEEERIDEEFRQQLAQISSAKIDALEIFDYLYSTGMRQYQPFFDRLSYDAVYEFLFKEELELENKLYEDL